MKSQPIKDLYFGEMGSTYDEQNQCYYLDKDIEFEKINTTVILYLEATEQRSTKNQQIAFEFIKRQFPKIWDAVSDFLTVEEKIITSEKLKKEHRLESITIPKNITTEIMEWEIDLLNLKDGFSRIVVEMKNDKPVHLSVEG